MSTILVIDDNPTDMRLATFLLRSVGHRVLSAVDAEAGIAIARSDMPDLILMNVELPDMDGLEATRTLKQDHATRSIPVVALTVRTTQGDDERMKAAGYDGYIAKPFAYRDFLTIVAAELTTTAF